MEEIWNRPPLSGLEYYGLGVEEVVMIQHPAEKGKGDVFFGVASSPLADKEDLETRFMQAYQTALPEIKAIKRQPFEQGGLVGFEIAYQRPWGEPWWQFRDIWLEHDGKVYVLSFHASPGSFENYIEIFDTIISGFRFKD